MSAADRDQIAELIKKGSGYCCCPVHAVEAADLILTSQWIVEHDALIRAEAQRDQLVATLRYQATVARDAWDSFGDVNDLNRARDLEARVKALEHAPNVVRPGGE